LHDGNLKIYCSSDIIRMIKSRLVRWTGCTPLIGEIIYANNIFVGIPEGESLGPRKAYALMRG
jgi:hypothetical protein